MRRQVESEFGVPFPGRILPRERWTRTACLDRGGGPFEWEQVFGRTARRVVDLGCGNGRYLIGSALARPACDHLGIDVVPRVVEYAARRANRRGLANVRFTLGEAAAWLSDRLGPASVDEIHLYHPQPYYRNEEVHLRLVTPEFLERAWNALRGDGILVLQTDNKPYWGYLRRAVRRHFDPQAVRGPWPDAPRGRTRREIIAHRKGLVIWRMVAHRRESPLDVPVPAPDFDANRPRFRRAAR